MLGTARRLLFTLLLASLGAGCIAPGGGGGAPEQATLAHAEFEPAWQHGPATVTFQDRTVDLPANTTYATDGRTWFYAAAGRNAHAPEAVEACREDARLEPGTEYVLVAADRCMWAAHPGVSCSATHACEDALGVPRKTQPPDPPPPSESV